MIIETGIAGWDNKLLKGGDVIYPQCDDCNAPNNYFLSIFAGARGSGKSFLATKLLKTLEKKGIYEKGKKIPMRTILLSTTAHSDSNKILKNLKSIDWDTDVIEEHNDEVLKDKIEELKEDLENANDYKKYREVWIKFKKINDVDELTEEEMILLNKYNFIPLKELPKPKYPEGFITTLFVDDMVGTNLFKNGRSYFTNLCIRHRHSPAPINIIITTQSIMMVSKTIRINANLIALFKFANKKIILNDLYPNISSYITEQEFEDIYNYATKDPHNALIIDTTKGKLILKQNFDKLLSFNNSLVS